MRALLQRQLVECLTGRFGAHDAVDFVCAVLGDGRGVSEGLGHRLNGEFSIGVASGIGAP